MNQSDPAVASIGHKNRLLLTTDLYDRFTRPMYTTDARIFPAEGRS